MPPSRSPKTLSSSRKAPARGKTPYQSRVIRNVLALSRDSHNYSVAKREWEYRGEVTDHGPLDQQIPKPAECQFCGHPIRYGYLLHNRFTGRRVEVGSECIGNYLDITPALAGRLEADKRDARKKRDARIQKHRRAVYEGARREFLRVLWTVESRYKAAGGYKAIGSPVAKDYFSIDAAGSNAATLYTAITDGRVTRLAARHGVVIDPRKLDAFVREAETMKRKDVVSAF